MALRFSKALIEMIVKYLPQLEHCLWERHLCCYGYDIFDLALVVGSLWDPMGPNGEPIGDPVVVSTNHFDCSHCALSILLTSFQV